MADDLKALGDLIAGEALAVLRNQMVFTGRVVDYRPQPGDRVFLNGEEIGDVVDTTVQYLREGGTTLTEITLPPAESLPSMVARSSANAEVAKPERVMVHHRRVMLDE